MIEADDYPLSGADLHWLAREIEAAHRAPLPLAAGQLEQAALDTEEMRYNPIPSVDAEFWRKQRALERECNAVTEREPAPWNRMLIVGAIACLIVFAAEVWGWM